MSDKLKNFIEKANLIHNSKYSYEYITEYINNKTKMPILCHKHGIFYMDANHHLLRKQGCPKCKTEKLSVYFKKYTTSEYIGIFKEKYGDKYDYSKVEYINENTEIVLICPKHGEFKRKPKSFLKGYECEECRGKHKHNKMTQEEFIDKVNELYGDNIDTSKVIYKGSDNEVELFCKKHNLYFKRKAYEVLHINACPQCGNEKMKEANRKTTEEFIEKAKVIHNNLYNYDKTIYINSKSYVIVTCPIHGDFNVIAGNHIHKTHPHGCPKCNKSYGEIIIEQALRFHNINFISQYTDTFLKTSTNGKQSIDFYLPDYNIGIEYQGVQHFMDIKYYGGEEAFQIRKTRDIIKYNKCKKEHIDLFYVMDRTLWKYADGIEIYNKDNSFFTIEELLNKKILNV